MRSQKRMTLTLLAAIAVTLLPITYAVAQPKPNIVFIMFTVGVAGCGKRTTFVVVCPEGGEGCFAAGPGKFLRDY